MRDFYRDLGLPDGCGDTDTIREMLRTNPLIPDSVRQSIVAILLNEKRRPVYERNRRTLVLIGQIRANLGVDQTEFWNLPDTEDFEYSPSGDGSILERARGRKKKVSATEEGQSRPSILANFVTLAIFLLVIGGLYSCFHRERSISPPFTARSAQAQNRPLSSGLSKVGADGGGAQKSPESAYTQLASAVPENGWISEKNFYSGRCPFTVVTRTGDRNYYYVKLAHPNQKNGILTFFVHGGQRFRTLVPPGTYELRYAAGKEWYGTKDLFGPSTAYSKADKLFNFRKTNDGYEGYTVELFLQLDGNLEIDPIRPEDF